MSSEAARTGQPRVRPWAFRLDRPHRRRRQAQPDHFVAEVSMRWLSWQNCLNSRSHLRQVLHRSPHQEEKLVSFCYWLVAGYWAGCSPPVAFLSIYRTRKANCVFANGANRDRGKLSDRHFAFSSALVRRENFDDDHEHQPEPT